MQFMIIGRDGQDEQAHQRRQLARPAHLETIQSLKANGHIVFVAALLNAQQQMVGSLIVCDFPDRGAVDAWLEVEPYRLQSVWHTVEVTPVAVNSVLSTPVPAS
jgi:uncharacterized protein